MLDDLDDEWSSLSELKVVVVERTVETSPVVMNLLNEERVRELMRKRGGELLSRSSWEGEETHTKWERYLDLW